MTYYAHLSNSSPTIIQSISQQNVSTDLFEKNLSEKAAFIGNESVILSSGKSAILPVMALDSDGDVNLPIASLKIINANTLSNRIGVQIGSSVSRTFSAGNNFFVSQQNISLSIDILDNGDQVYTNGFSMIIIPLKE
jgi:hypothetical protein